MHSPKTKRVPESHEFILTDRPVGHIATLRADGYISVNPVCLIWDGECVQVSTLKSRMKYKNLVRNPRVSISIPYRNNPNIYIELRGVAELSDDPDRSFINLIARTYLGVDEYPFDSLGDERAIITIHAEQVSAPEMPLVKDAPTAPDAAYQA